MRYWTIFLLRILAVIFVHEKYIETKSSRASHQNTVDFRGWSVIKARPDTETKVRYLSSLDNDGGNETEYEPSMVQIWRHGSLNKPFDIFTSPRAKSGLLAEMRSMRIKYDVVTEDIQRAIEKELEPTKSSTRSLRSDWFNRFLKFEEITDMLRNLQREHPNLVHVQSIGTSHEGRSIYVVKVSSGGNAKPAIWIDGGIHAREWIATSTVLYMMDKLVTGYGTNADEMRALLDRLTWYFVPVLNPDGYVYTRTNRMWRKNRRPRDCLKPHCCVGVDLNRNFDFEFGTIGTSRSSCRETYAGPAAFSEPESRAVKDFIFGRKGEVTAFITLHSYSQMWFYPFGNRVGFYPKDKSTLEMVAKRAAEALRSVRGTKYEVGTAADLLYPSSGGSDDWAKGKAGVEYVYCLELVPNGNTLGNGFIIRPTEIVPVGEETWAGMKVVAEAVLQRRRG